MSMPNIKPSDKLTLLAVLDPISQGAATVTTAWVSMATFENMVAVIHSGVLGASATLDAKLQQAQDGSGTGAKDITGKALVQLTKAASKDNKQAFINLRSEELDVNGGFSYVRLSVTVAVAASLISAELYGLDARYQPATQATSVDQAIA